jgi:hypothetical protein
VREGVVPVVVVWLENILPLSHISSEGGKVSVVVTLLCDWKTPFPSCISSEGEVEMWLESTPSVSHFKGGDGDVVGKCPLCLAFQAREDDGDVGRGNISS